MIDSILRTALLGALVCSAGAFLAGIAAGRRAREGGASGKIVLGIAVLIPLLLLGGTWGLAKQIGPLISWEALLLGGAVALPLLGGFQAGAQWRRKRIGGARGYTLLTLGAVAVLLGTLSQINGRVAQAAKQLGLDVKRTKYEPEKDKACPENLKSLYLAFSLYTQDWSALPPAEHWMENEDLTSKVRQNEWLHCPAVSNRHDEKFGYAYNETVAGRKLDGKPLNQLPDAARTPLLYDSTNLAKSAHDAIVSLPKPGRHGGRDYVLYCDGHVEAVEPK